MDGVLAIREGTKVLKGLKAAEKLAGLPKSDVIVRIPREELIKIQKAVDGDAGAKQALEALRQKYGNDVDDAYDLLKDSEIRIIDDVEAATITGKGSEEVNLDNIPPELRAEYLKVIATDVEKGQKLLEFRNFGSPERFKNVLNALDSVDDVKRLKRVFNEDYLNSLVDSNNLSDVTMKTRYEWLLNDVADGNVPPAEFKERLSILEKIKNIQDAVENKVGTEAYRGNAFGNPIYSRNYAVGDYKITYASVGAKPKTISDDYISISGKKMPPEINSFTSKQTVDVEGAKRKFIPAAPKGEKTRLPVRRNKADQDSERKLFAHILKELEKISGKKLNPNMDYTGQGFRGGINITSQMKPCNSCQSLIEEELLNMFGNDIKVKVKYGVDFEK